MEYTIFQMATNTLPKTFAGLTYLSEVDFKKSTAKVWI